MARFEVIVQNIGKVHEGTDEVNARKTFAYYIDKSKKELGRCGGAGVSLWRDNEPIEEYDPGDWQ